MTATLIAEQLNYPLKIFMDNRIREKEFGRLHAIKHEDLKARYPDDWKARQRDGKYYHRMPGGENYPDVEQRLHSFLDKLHRDYAGQSVLVTTHRVPYLLFQALFQHLGEQEVLSLGDVPNCGIAEYHLDTSRVPEGRLRMMQWNRTAYDMKNSPQFDV
ncbi:MAG: histidine phosphatase family protein [Candidatus Aenigmarchaeota archaeon]|nr:histidine phosphatase family protein [Candidatus Aenigmarchaeota archaeon]